MLCRIKPYLCRTPGDGAAAPAQAEPPEAELIPKPDNTPDAANTARAEPSGDTPEPAETGAANPPAGDAPAQSSPQSSPPQNLGEALRKAVAERTARAEKGVLRSMAAQYGMEEAALAAALQAARDAQTELPPDAQARIHAMQARFGERLRMMDVKAIGAELGLIDPDAAIRLMDADSIAVAEDGSVQGTREALDALRRAKPYLFRQAGAGAWAQRLDGGGIPSMTGVEAAFYRKNPALKGGARD
ncbi:MAG: hypothetical protein VB087_04560 [Candidatus Limiplasma sp.]|nr:hypothetical protein [Candidatus Limiplasma sp.]MEA5145444.1 hypothetical protein [Candidatus Limiplasma sp.]